MLFGFLLRNSGFRGFNEIGDFVIWLAGIFQSISGWRILPYSEV